MHFGERGAPRWPIFARQQRRLDPFGKVGRALEPGQRQLAHALAQLAYYKAPGYVAFVDAVPLTPSQKIQRGQLRELARALPGQAACVDTRSLKKRQR